MSFPQLLDLRAEESRVVRYVKRLRCVEVSRKPRTQVIGAQDEGFLPIELPECPMARVFLAICLNFDDFCQFLFFYSANPASMSRGSHGSVIMTEREASAMLDRVVEKVMTFDPGLVLSSFFQCRQSVSTSSLVLQRSSTFSVNGRSLHDGFSSFLPYLTMLSTYKDGHATVD